MLSNDVKIHINSVRSSFLNVVDDCNSSLTNLLQVLKAYSNPIYINKLCHNNVYIEFIPYGVLVITSNS